MTFGRGTENCFWCTLITWVLCKLHPQPENAGNGISGPLYFKIFCGGGGGGGGACLRPPLACRLGPCLLISYPRQLEILVTALLWAL